MGDHSNNDSFSNPRVSILLFGIGSAALIVSIYHCIAIGWCRRSGESQNGSRPPQPRTLMVELAADPSMENSTAQLIPAHKYQKGDMIVGESMCSICLCEFEDGEELRTLPECVHSFHVPCIDMWLYSQVSCPMCRADATPSPQIFPSSNPGSNQQRDHQVTLEQVLVQSIQV